MNITGLIAIGNGEKCPYCDKIMEEDTNIGKHMIDFHAKQVIGELFDAPS